MSQQFSSTAAISITQVQNVFKQASLEPPTKIEVKSLDNYTKSCTCCCCIIISTSPTNKTLENALKIVCFKWFTRIDSLVFLRFFVGYTYYTIKNTQKCCQNCEKFTSSAQVQWQNVNNSINFSCSRPRSFDNIYPSLSLSLKLTRAASFNIINRAGPRAADHRLLSIFSAARAYPLQMCFRLERHTHTPHVMFVLVFFFHLLCSLFFTHKTLFFCWVIWLWIQSARLFSFKIFK